MTVNVVDLNEERIAAWNSTHLPIHEAGLPKVVRIARDGTRQVTVPSPKSGESITLPARQPNLFFTSDVTKCLPEADIIFICVNTPTKMHGVGAGATADLFALESATRTVAKHAKVGAIIVEKSTVPCRTSKMLGEIVSFLPFPYEYAGVGLWLTELVASTNPARNQFRDPIQPGIPR
jgi:UDPglucose 6-dehydrogenase